MPAFPTSATPAFFAAAPEGFTTTQPRAAPPIPVAPPLRTAPSGIAEAAPSGPSEWFVQANGAINQALGSTGGVLAVLGRHSSAERHRDVFYLDRLTESLRAWEAKMQELADPFRKKRFE
jgi:hypothetical protein